MPDSNSDYDYSRGIVRCISRLERHRRKYINENLKDSDMKGSMFMALLYLSHSQGASQDNLCNELIIDKGNAARLCKMLEDNGYIVREQSPLDRRQNMLFLTEKGKEQIPRIRKYLHDWARTATDGLTQEELDTLTALLEKMRNNIESL